MHKRFRHLLRLQLGLHFSRNSPGDQPGGRLFVSGPLPENKQMFYDIIKEATNLTIPPMPGSSRFKGEIFDTINKIFTKTELHKFKNTSPSLKLRHS